MASKKRKKTVYRTPPAVKLGSVVYLPTVWTGPEMVVEKITFVDQVGCVTHPEDLMTCLWWDEPARKFRRDKFNRCVLTRSEDYEGGG